MTSLAEAEVSECASAVCSQTLLDRRDKAFTVTDKSLQDAWGNEIMKKLHKHQNIIS